MARCYICDNELSETEIQLGEDNKLEPCGSCLTIIFDTAFTNGFTPAGKEGNGEEIDLLENEEDSVT